MKYKKIAYHILLSVAILAAAAIQSCSEEVMPDIPDYTLSDVPVDLKVSVVLPKMDVKTRANLTNVQLNMVNDVWVRTYSADTKQATSDWKIVEITTTGTEESHDVEIRSRSGQSYIVAVANVKDKIGVKKGNLESQSLSTLLESADTWEQFLDIAVPAPSTLEDVRAPLPPLVMVGCYSDIIVGGNHPEPTNLADWQARDIKSYFIPAQNGTVDFTAQGAIHLRRTVSHLNFRVVPGDGVNVTVNSYQVMNAPRYSWLYERPATGGMLANFGDLATSAQNAADVYYADVPQYGAQYVNTTVENSKKISTFDFWQAENKHTGTADSYNKRDEYTGTDPVLFTSLTDGRNWTPNNEASYVLVSCSVEYDNNLHVNEKGEEVGSGGAEVKRTGEVTYLIHLGYINGTATDFNCFRNVDYNYTLTVNGINDIRVDAYAEDETYHGEEGMVVDLEYATIDIDAHYAAFNIVLTETELNDTKFGFIIIAYEDGNQYIITDANDQQQVGDTKVIYTSENTPAGEEITGKEIDPKYYNWIELRPTTGANVLARYKPRYGDNADGSTFLLTDLKGGWNSMTPNMKSESGYYTVFVNEYTYEPIYDGNNNSSYGNEDRYAANGLPAWMSYVNENPRRFYIRTTQQVSPDGNSIYARSKYGVSQSSIMTFFSDLVFTTEGTALGIERDNETLGLNLRCTYGGGTSTSNGRWNAGMWLGINSGPSWDDYVEYDYPLSVPAVTGTRAQRGPEIQAHTSTIPKPVRCAADNATTFTDPQEDSQYNIEAINACISRNRDNNGDGFIDPEELRWYVPAMDQYLRMMLGSRSLPEPMIDYDAIASLPRYDADNYNWVSGDGGSFANDYCSRYMYISSNQGRNVMWTMEGTSTSVYDKLLEWSHNHSRPWQVRCVRNMGTDLRTVVEESKLIPPYVHNAATHTFAMTYYDLQSIRAESYNGNGTADGMMPVHTIPQSYNRTYYGFQYASSDYSLPEQYRSNDQKDFTTNIKEYIKADPCAEIMKNESTTGWRLPNQEELTIMRNAGLLTHSTNPSALWLSCTVNYFNTSGVGSKIVDNNNNQLFLIVTPDQGTQATSQNLINAGIHRFIRCVRDVRP